MTTKHIFTILLMVFIMLNLNGQTYEVSYTESKNIENKLKKIKDPLLKAKIKSQLKTNRTFTLKISDNSSLYSFVATNSPSEQTSTLKMVAIRSQESKVFKNYSTFEYLEETSLMQEDFLIVDGIPKLDWKLVSEEKQISGYTCSKAITSYMNREIEAWYTQDISIADGPYIYTGLPGLILELHTPYKSYLATKISKTELLEKIDKPSKGKKVDRKAFEELEREKIIEMTSHSTTKM